MDNRELALYRLMSGKVPVSWNDREYFICVPSITQKLRAEEIYHRTYYESLFNETVHEDDILAFIVRAGFWTEKDSEDIVKAQNDIETFKVELYNSMFQSIKEKHVRNVLQMAKDEYERLYTKRHQYDFLTPKGIATLAKNSYLIAVSTFDMEGNRLIEDFTTAQMDLVNHLVGEYNDARLEETELRKLARTEPWRSYWNAGKKEGRLFDISPVDYSDDQRMLVLWSSLYDSVYDNSEAPSDNIIDDDDMLDGWLIIQRRKVESEKLRRRGEEAVGKANHADEVFVVAQTLEDAKKVDALNTFEGRQKKRVRFEAMKQFASTAEGDLPDVKRDIHMQLNRMATERMKQ